MASMGGNLLPAHALRVLPRRRLAAATSASPGTGCAALDGLQPRARDPRHQRALHRHASRPTSPSRWWRSTPSCTRSGRTASARSRRRLLPAPRRHAAARASARARRADRRRSRCPAAPIARALGLPQVPRPAVVRVRAGVGRGGARGATTAWSPTCGWRSAASAPSPGARAAPRPRWSARPATAEAFRRAARGELEPAPSYASTTRSRSSSRSGRSCARSTTAVNGRRDDRGVGTPVDRVDGPAKVTGAARYTAEIALPGPGATPASSARPSPAGG